MNRNKFQRLNQEERENIRKMTLDGKSLNKITKLTGLGKTTIYYNVKDLKPRQWRKLIVSLPDEKIGELMGAFAGDGSYYHAGYLKGNCHHNIRYSLCLSRDMEYAMYLIDLLKKLNLNPFLYKKLKENAMDISLNSKEYIRFIHEFLEWDDVRSHSIRLKFSVENYNQDFIKGFARGLMDTDGFVEVSNVSCGSTSERLIKNLAEIFDKSRLRYKISVKIRAPLRKNLFLIRVYRDSLEDYKKTIGFSNPYKLQKLNKILNNGVAEI